MNEEQRKLFERIIELYDEHKIDYFEYYIDQQEFEEDWERMWKRCPEAILRDYEEQYQDWHEDFIAHNVTREQMIKPLNLLRDLRKYVAEHPGEGNGSSKNMEDRSETR